MSSGRRLTVLVVAVAVLSCTSVLPPAIPTDGWIELQSPYFTIVTNRDEDALRRTALDLERFIAIVQDLTTVPRVAPTAPTQIFVVDNLKQFYRLMGGGGTIGFTLASADGTYMVLPYGPSDARTQTVLYHEFVHYLLFNGGRDYPSWYHEGLAELLSTTQVRDGAASIGMRPALRREGILSGRLIGLSEFLSVRSFRDLPRRAQRMYYPQAWAFVHYLHASEARREFLARYLREFDPTDEVVPAIESALGGSIESLESDFERYWESLRKRVRFYSRRAPEGDFESGWSIAPVPEARMAMRLAEFLLIFDDSGAAHPERYLRRALRDDPKAADVVAALAWARSIAGDELESRELRSRAESIAPGSADVWRSIGRALAIRAEREGGTDARSTRVEARAAFQRSVELDPGGGAFRVYADIAKSYRRERDLSAVEAEAAIAQLGPLLEHPVTNARVALGLGVLHARAGDDSRAAVYLRRALAFAHDEDISDEAQAELDALNR